MATSEVNSCMVFVAVVFARERAVMLRHKMAESDWKKITMSLRKIAIRLTSMYLLYYITSLDL